MSLSMTDIQADDDKCSDEGKLPDCDNSRKTPDFDKWSDDGKLSDEDDGYTEEEMSPYWTSVWKPVGFDVKLLKNRIKRPPWNDIHPFYFERPDDCPNEIALYAKFGIHWYNMLHGKNLQLSCVQKYNYLHRCVFSSTKYITCLAMDPACGVPQVFLTGIVDDVSDVQTIVCFIARPKIAQQENPVELSNEEPPEPYCYGPITLPEWPSENALRDKSRFYLVKKADLLKYDWIRLYLELAFVKANKKLTNPDLSKLVILGVVVQSRQENLEPPTERLKAVNSVFYIKYKYFPHKGKGLRSLKPPCVRIAIIKRTMDKHRRRITLMFEPRYENTLLKKRSTVPP